MMIMHSFGGSCPLAITIPAAACGIGSLISASVGTGSTCLTGPVNAILASAGAKESGHLFVSFGAMAAGHKPPVNMSKRPNSND